MRPSDFVVAMSLELKHASHHPPSLRGGGYSNGETQACTHCSEAAEGRGSGTTGWHGDGMRCFLKQSCICKGIDWTYGII